MQQENTADNLISLQTPLKPQPSPFTEIRNDVKDLRNSHQSAYMDYILHAMDVNHVKRDMNNFIKTEVKTSLYRLYQLKIIDGQEYTRLRKKTQEMFT